MKTSMNNIIDERSRREIDQRLRKSQGQGLRNKQDQRLQRDPEQRLRKESDRRPDTTKAVCGSSARLNCLIFVIFLVGMALSLLLGPAKSFSENENRYLARFPVLSIKSVTDGSFMNGMESYVSDHLALRDFWFFGNAGLMKLSGQTCNNGICFADEDTLISLEQAPEPERALSNLSYIERFEAAVDIPLVLGIIPTTQSVYRERLPAGAPAADEAAFIDMIYQQTKLPCADLVGVMNEHLEEPIYYRTDLHWTSLGALYGANAMLRALNLEPLDVDAMIKNRVIQSTDFVGSYWSESGAFWTKPDTVETYAAESGITVEVYNSPVPEEGSLYETEYLETKDKYSFFLGGNHPLCVIHTQSEGPRLLLIRDSFGSSLAPLLTERFSEIHLVDLRYYRASLRDYVKEHEIDCVMVLYGVRTFWNDSNLGVLLK